MIIRNNGFGFSRRSERFGYTLQKAEVLILMILFSFGFKSENKFPVTAGMSAKDLPIFPGETRVDGLGGYSLSIPEYSFGNDSASIKAYVGQGVVDAVFYRIKCNDDSHFQTSLHNTVSYFRDRYGDPERLADRPPYEWVKPIYIRIVTNEQTHVYGVKELALPLDTSKPRVTTHRTRWPLLAGSSDFMIPHYANMRRTDLADSSYRLSVPSAPFFGKPSHLTIVVGKKDIITSLEYSTQFQDTSLFNNFSNIVIDSLSRRLDPIGHTTDAAGEVTYSWNSLTLGTVTFSVSRQHLSSIYRDVTRLYR